MPRAYFYDAAGGREAVSGSLQREKVEAWLGQPSSRRAFRTGSLQLAAYGRL
jgi:hypothetical protein